MLVGHCAVALAGKRAEPALSLGTLMAAAVLAAPLWAQRGLGVGNGSLRRGRVGRNAHLVAAPDEVGADPSVAP